MVANVNVNFEAMNIKYEIEDILYATDLKPSEIERLTEKLLNLHIVSHQRELLKAFQEHYEKTLRDDWIYDEDIESFLKDFNCG